MGNKATYHFSENAWRMYSIYYGCISLMFLVYYFTICLPPAVPSLVDVSWLSKCIYGQPKTGCEQCGYCSSAFAPKWPQKQSQSVSWAFKYFMGGMPSDPPNLACLRMYTYTPDNAYACIRTHQTTMATGLIMHGKTSSFCALASSFRFRLDCACALWTLSRDIMCVYSTAS